MDLEHFPGVRNGSDRDRRLSSGTPEAFPGEICLDARRARENAVEFHAVEKRLIRRRGNIQPLRRRIVARRGRIALCGSHRRTARHRDEIGSIRACRVRFDQQPARTSACAQGGSQYADQQLLFETHRVGHPFPPFSFGQNALVFYFSAYIISLPHKRAAAAFFLRTTDR